MKTAMQSPAAARIPTNSTLGIAGPSITSGRPKTWIRKLIRANETAEAAIVHNPIVPKHRSEPGAILSSVSIIGCFLLRFVLLRLVCFAVCVSLCVCEMELPTWCNAPSGQSIEAQALEVWRAPDLDAAIEVVHNNNEVAMLITGGVPGLAIRCVNKAWERTTGFAEEEVIGSSTTFLQGPGTNEKSVEELSICLRRGEPADVTFTNYRRHKQRFTNHLRCFPLALGQDQKLQSQRNANEQNERDEKQPANRFKDKKARLDTI